MPAPNGGLMLVDPGFMFIARTMNGWCDEFAALLCCIHHRKLHSVGSGNGSNPSPLNIELLSIAPSGREVGV
jgi:hypothetical protein